MTIAITGTQRRERQFERLLPFVSTEEGRRTAILMAVEKRITRKPEYVEIARAEQRKWEMPHRNGEVMGLAEATAAADANGSETSIVPRVRDFKSAISTGKESGDVYYIARAQEMMGAFRIAAYNYANVGRALGDAETLLRSEKLLKLANLFRKVDASPILRLGLF